MYWIEFYKDGIVSVKMGSYDNVLMDQSEGWNCIHTWNKDIGIDEEPDELARFDGTSWWVKNADGTATLAGQFISVKDHQD